jgi:hypothetical protein
MYPERELSLLATRKAVLRGKIAHRRIQTSADLAQLTKPLEIMDKAAELWRKIPSLAKLAVVPVALVVLKKTLFRRTKLLSSLLRWGPLAYNAVKGMGAVSSQGQRD